MLKYNNYHRQFLLKITIFIFLFLEKMAFSRFCRTKQKFYFYFQKIKKFQNMLEIRVFWNILEVSRVFKTSMRQRRRRSFKNPRCWDLSLTNVKRINLHESVFLSFDSSEDIYVYNQKIIQNYLFNTYCDYYYYELFHDHFLKIYK